MLTRVEFAEERNVNGEEKGNGGKGLRRGESKNGLVVSLRVPSSGS
jgi:hypothetical protein